MGSEMCIRDRSNRAREFVLMFISTLVEKMYFVGSGDGDGRVDGDVGDSDTDDTLVIAFEIFDLSF